MSLYHRVMSPKDADGMANSVDLEEQSDLGLHCLPRHICPKTWDHYGKIGSNGCSGGFENPFSLYIGTVTSSLFQRKIPGS